VYRAFFAVPRSITDPEGRPVNAVRGYLDMVARLATDRGPSAVVHVLDDDWRPAPRVAAYAGYKAQRPEEPPDLPHQFEVLDRVLAALGAARARAPGWEADDAIATLCARAGPDDAIDVVTGDRDLIQLVRDGRPSVRVLYTLRGVSNLLELDEAGVMARHGVPPGRYVDYATLRGDPSDGLPGVAGVGEKTARALVAEHPSIEAMLAAADGLPARLGASLRAAAGYLDAMREVVPARTDVGLEEAAGERDDALLDALAERHGLGGSLDRIRAALPA